MPSRVEHSVNGHRITGRLIEYGMRKTSHQCAPIFGEDDCVKLWLARDPAQAGFHATEELVAKAPPTFFVPAISFENIRLGSRTSTSLCAMAIANPLLDCLPSST
jgi:hypothetical protein